MQKRQVLRLAAAGLLPLALPHRAAAQQRPLVILVGYAAGSAVDVVARLAAERLREALGRPVVVDNRPGAGGQIALSALANGAADGSLVALTPASALTLVPLTYAQVPYNPRDFVPVASTASAASVLVVGAAHPARSLGEFAAWSRDNPCNIGNPGYATVPHFSAWRLARAMGVDVQHVPYRVPPQIALDLVNGQLTSGFSALPDFVELARAGRLRILATSARERGALFPDVPTIAEAGYPGIVEDNWYGVVAHARTPPAARAELEAALRAVAAEPGHRNAVVALGLSPAYRTSQDLAARVAAESEAWAALVRESGFRVL